MSRLMGRCAALLVLLHAAPAVAHSFGKLYNLPVPLWMYLYGAMAALALSFVIVGYFVSSGDVQRNERVRDLDPRGWSRWLLAAPVRSTLRVLSVCALVLTVLTGLFGTRNPYDNFSMTYFWIIFVLGFVYLTALTGNFYALINPWQVIVEWLQRLRPGLFDGRWRYPQRLGHTPALALYILFIWIELFAHTRPHSLAILLMSYSAINFVGAWAWGRRDWFRYAEFFAVFLRLVSLMAPLERAPGPGLALRLRQPYMGLARKPAESMSLLLFILFMLSSTAFDGVRNTVPWVRLYWQDIYRFLLPYAGGDMLASYPLFQTAYKIYQACALVLSPVLYLLVYLFFIALAKRITRSAVPLRELSLRFAHSLIPIALVYNVTHYYTLLQTQAPEMLRLLSDPFGWGWNLLGTAGWRFNIIPDAGTVWHVQVWLILFGHIVSVYLAHLEALRIFGNQRQAALSQIPMLVLMVILTSAGLWILAQPITSGQIYVPTGKS